MPEFRNSGAFREIVMSKSHSFLGFATMPGPDTEILGLFSVHVPMGLFRPGHAAAFVR